MTIDWEKFAALRSMEDDGEEGGFTAPGEAGDEEEGGQYTENWLGRFTRRQEPPDISAEEQALLDEDFPEEVANR
jgi:hypothetical protein